MIEKKFAFLGRHFSNVSCKRFTVQALLHGFRVIGLSLKFVPLKSLNRRYSFWFCDEKLFLFSFLYSFSGSCIFSSHAKYFLKISLSLFSNRHRIMFESLKLSQCRGQSTFYNRRLIFVSAIFVSSTIRKKIILKKFFLGSCFLL